MGRISHSTLLKAWYGEYARRGEPRGMGSGPPTPAALTSRRLPAPAGLYFGSLASLFPFLNVLYRRYGLDERQVGILGMVRPWVSGASSPVAAHLADRVGRHRAAMLACAGAAFLARLSIAGVGAAPAGARPYLLAAAVVAMEASSGPVTVFADAITHAREDDYGKHRLWGAVGWGLMALLTGALGDRVGVARAVFPTFVLLSAASLYPTLLLDYGAISAGGGGDGTRDAAEDEPGAGKDVELVPMLGASHGAAGDGSPRAHRRASAEGPREGRAGGPAGGVPGPGGGRESGAGAGPAGGGARDEEGGPAGGAARPHRGAGARAPLWAALRHGRFLELAACALAWGFCVGVIEGFLFLALEDLGAPAVLWGATLTVTCAAEVPVFHYATALAGRFGETALTHAVFAAFALRLGYYSLLGAVVPPGAVLPAELLHGVTFAVAWAVGSTVARDVAPPGLGPTLQGAFQAVYFGAGPGLGALFGGLLYYRVGPAAMFRSAMAVALVGWAGFSLFGGRHRAPGSCQARAPA